MKKGAVKKSVKVDKVKGEWIFIQEESVLEDVKRLQAEFYKLERSYEIQERIAIVSHERAEMLQRLVDKVELDEAKARMENERLIEALRECYQHSGWESKIDEIVEDILEDLEK